MKYYISCVTFDHGKINTLKSELDKIGHVCIYEWRNEKTNKKHETLELAFKRTQAIETAELYLCILPMTHTSAIEFGVALASRCGKRVIVWSQSQELFDDKYVNMYFKHPSVTTLCCPFNDLIEYLKKL